MQFIILLLALRGTTDYNKMEINCKHITATWVSGEQIGIRYQSTEYVTIFTKSEDLDTELQKHCPRYF